MGNGPPGPSIVCSRAPAISAAGAIRAMRASYCARATSTGTVWVAGTPVPLSSNAWICGSSGISTSLLLNGADHAALPRLGQLGAQVVGDLVARARVPAAALGDRRVLDLGEHFQGDEHRARAVENLGQRA